MNILYVNGIMLHPAFGPDEDGNRKGEGMTFANSLLHPAFGPDEDGNVIGYLVANGGAKLHPAFGPDEDGNLHNPPF